MRAIFLSAVSLAALSGCGLENFLSNVGRAENARPASTVTGALPAGAKVTGAVGLDASGQEVEPFLVASRDGGYEVRLPSSNYSMLRLEVRSGDAVLRGIVPSIGEESAVTLDLDARTLAETLIVEAAASLRDTSFALISPDVFVGDRLTTGTRTLLRQAFDQAGPAQDVVRYVERIVARNDPSSLPEDPFFFRVPVVTVVEGTPQVTTSPVSAGWLSRTLLDYDGDGINDLNTTKFDEKLLAAAQSINVEGCADPSHIRLVFSVDFNEGNLDGRCQVAGNWVVAPDQADKRMFFVGWINQASAVQDTAIAELLGNGVPNQIPMFDDGTNGDEVGGDGIWTIAFSVPFDPGNVLRVGYKYTWGFRGMSWTKTEEWPGNSRVLEVVDVNDDDIVYRRDIFGDEATNKNLANLHPQSGGTLEWDEALHGCGPEAREQPFTLHNSCQCGSEWFTPRAIGPVRVACSE